MNDRAGERAKPLRSDRIRVLLVEDDPAHAEAVRRVLRASKTLRFDVATVASLSAAVPVARSNGCDVVLLQLALPDSPAASSVMQLALGAPLTPIIAFAGAAEAAHLEQAVRQGAQDYFIKGEDDLRALDRIVRSAIERKAFEARLAERAYYDPLTGLANRALFQDRLTHIVARARRLRLHAALMLIDLDGFKGINDTLGHDAGDRVLQTVARRLLGAVRESESLARLGGDEFTVLLEPIAEPQAARAPAERILDALQAPLEISGGRRRVTPSIGIALFPDHAPDAAGLLRHADAAMYLAKKAGRNNFQFYSP
jgi:diguanylate cyclase (GGDEF)-like protein